MLRVSSLQDLHSQQLSNLLVHLVRHAAFFTEPHVDAGDKKMRASQSLTSGHPHTRRGGRVCKVLLKALEKILSFLSQNYFQRTMQSKSKSKLGIYPKELKPGLKGISESPSS